MQKTVLLTGFEPFGEYAINSSWEASRLVGAQLMQPVVARCLPVDYAPAREALLAALTQYQPTICLCTGLTSDTAFAVERVARKPAQFSALPGPALLEGAWPWAELEQQLQTAGCAAITSYDAGQYVCESTYWSLLDFRQQFGYPAYAAFIHIPPLSPELTAPFIATALGNVLQARRASRDNFPPAHATRM